MARLREEIKVTDAASLGDERDALRLLALVRETKDQSDEDAVRAMLDSDDLLLGTLRSGLSENLSNSLGDVTVQREAVLAAWAWLETLIGAESLVQRIRSLPAPIDPDEATSLTIETENRYADGWRRESFARTEPQPREGTDQPPQIG